MQSLAVELSRTAAFENLSERTRVPQRPLQLVQGPERIESGWWDGLDVRRDYFIAESTCHARYWIYRELPQARAWYLHGLFG